MSSDYPFQNNQLESDFANLIFVNRLLHFQSEDEKRRTNKTLKGGLKFKILTAWCALEISIFVPLSRLSIPYSLKL